MNKLKDVCTCKYICNNIQYSKICNKIVLKIMNRKLITHNALQFLERMTGLYDMKRCSRY